MSLRVGSGTSGVGSSLQLRQVRPPAADRAPAGNHAHTVVLERVVDVEPRRGEQDATKLDPLIGVLDASPDEWGVGQRGQRGRQLVGEQTGRRRSIRPPPVVDGLGLFEGLRRDDDANGHLRRRSRSIASSAEMPC